MPDPRPHAGNFSAVVADLHRGELIDQLDDEIAEVVTAVRETGKKGSLTLTISVSSPRRGSDEVVVNAKTKAVAPKGDRLGATFYDNDGRLQREDPRQTRLELGERESV